MLKFLHTCIARNRKPVDYALRKAKSGLTKEGIGITVPGRGAARVAVDKY